MPPTRRRPGMTPMPDQSDTTGMGPSQRKPAGGQQKQMLPTPPPPPFPGPFKPLPAAGVNQMLSPSQEAPGGYGGQQVSPMGQSPLNPDMGQLIQTLKALLHG